MLTINSAALSTVSNIQQPSQANEIVSENSDEVSGVSETSSIAISDQARELLAVEEKMLVQHQQLVDLNYKDQLLKMQYSENLELFIDDAQRYNQQDVAAPFIENRAAIDAYSLIANKVVATVATNELAA
ncbi:MAG: hypothetical protein ACI9ES_001073 [Oceanospirillaceae bacterium]|jgi:hypothetical protein